MDIDIETDPEFASLLPPLSEEQMSALTADILRYGCRDRLLFWRSGDGRNILVDGHHRFAICKTQNIPFDVAELEFECREDAAEWALTHQGSRRNVTPEQLRLLRENFYERRKARYGDASRFQENSMESRPNAKVQNLHFGEKQSKSVADEVARQTGVSRRTIYNDVKFAKELDEAEKIEPGIKRRIWEGKATKKDVRRILGKTKKSAAPKPKPKPEPVAEPEPPKTPTVEETMAAINADIDETIAELRAINRRITGHPSLVAHGKSGQTVLTDKAQALASVNHVIKQLEKLRPVEVCRLCHGDFAKCKRRDKSYHHMVVEKSPCLETGWMTTEDIRTFKPEAFE